MQQARSEYVLQVKGVVAGGPRVSTILDIAHR